MRSKIVTSVFLACCCVVGLCSPVAAGADDPWPYTWPTDAPVVDPFRPPSTPYGAGNRGLEFATDPGSAVHAARAGLVTFAGQVGGQLHVTLAHRDGVRTSYSFVASIVVSKGSSVATGQVIATSGQRLHVGARIGSAYIDPAILFGASTRVRLVPVSGSQAQPLTGWVEPNWVRRDSPTRKKHDLSTRK
ncbi:MAG: murein DD-endopeptidase MepM/ murein hydrolase activator NlpD [Candidatus Poriferisodalaceae bacterium]|jgi:murein DD-endopeptidase MepM/ murein hydrolase activator NlpD